jgi:hypothetical protein
MACATAAYRPLPGATIVDRFCPASEAVESVQSLRTRHRSWRFLTASKWPRRRSVWALQVRALGWQRDAWNNARGHLAGCGWIQHGSCYGTHSGYDDHPLQARGSERGSDPSRGCFHTHFKQQRDPATVVPGGVVG